METKDTYRTLENPSEEVLYKDKSSKFLGYAYPVQSEYEVKVIIETLKKRHYNARHWCYAYQIGTENIQFRTNDDGEPNNSAGTPIYGQIQSFELTNILIVVVRYFGGTKLGVSGLITAYKTTTQMALEKSSIIEKTINIHYILHFDYKNINKVMRIIKEKNLNIVNQKMETSCKIEITTRKKNAEIIFSIFNNLYEIDIQLKD